MFEIIMSSFSNSDNREIDEYHDSSNGSSYSNSNSSNSNSSNSSSSSSSSSSNSGGNTTDKQYTSGVLGVPLEAIQEKLRIRMASRS